MQTAAKETAAKAEAANAEALETSESMEVDFGVEGTCAVGSALFADDDFVIVNKNGKVLEKVSEVLCALENTGELHVVHIEVSHQLEACKAKLGGCAAITLTHFGNTRSYFFPFNHIDISP